MKFYKEMMLKRVADEGRSDMVDEECLRIMDDLDGQEARAWCWARQVEGLPVYWVVGKSGEGHLVNENDCR